MTTPAAPPIEPPQRREPLGRVLRDAALIVLVSTCCALGTNAARSDGIPFFAHAEYDILVPCPEPEGAAEGIAPTDERVVSRKTLLIDARDPADFETWHLPDAISVPLDWLAEQQEIDAQARTVAQQVARSGKRDVVVYGDGSDPDSGQYWAGLLVAAGIKRVVYVSGGAPALRQAGIGPGGKP